MRTYAEKLKDSEARTPARKASQTRGRIEPPFQLADNRPEAARLQRLQTLLNGSPQVKQFKTLQEMADSSPQVNSLHWPVQAAMAASVVQLQRTVTNRMRDNMQVSLSRVFGGPAGRYQIDQESGSTFNDGPPHRTTGHHNVQVTDTRTGQVYHCDFHRDGAWYTRG